MPTIQNTVKDAAGNLLNGTTNIDLIIFPGGSPSSFQGFVDLGSSSTDYTINRDATVNIVNGGWSATVRGNAAIEDAYGGSVTTYYKISETCNGVTRTYYILAPNTGSTYWVGDLIAIDPETFSTSVTLDSISDVSATSPADGDIIRFEASSGQWVATTIPGLTGSVYKDILQFSAPGILATVPGTMGVVIPYTFVITGVYLHVGTPATGGSIFCDVNISGSTVFASGADRRPRIASGASNSTQGAPGAGDNAFGSAGSYVAVDIDSVGSPGNEGHDLTVSIAVIYS